MSHTLNPVDRLGPPFCQVDEQVFTIPDDGYNEVANKFFKLVFLLDGDCWHEVESGARVRLVPGDVLVVPRRCLHRYRPLSRTSSHRLHALRLIFDPAILPPLTDDAPAGIAEPETDLAAFVRRHLGTYQHLRLGNDSEVQALLASLRRHAEQRLPGYRLQVTALCTELVVLIGRQASRINPAAATKGPRKGARLVEQARGYLVKNLEHELTLARIAEHLRVSPEHLARVFRQETGQTVFGLLQALRLEKAKTYLLGSDLNISEIARLTGFSSLPLFSRTFKRAIGVSPLAYRQDGWSRARPNASVLNQPAPSRSETVL